VLKIAKGYTPEYLLKEVATGRENYYTGAVAAGEPPGRWWGARASKLGLTGLTGLRPSPTRRVVVALVGGLQPGGDRIPRDR
jgi:hypothetical protein